MTLGIRVRLLTPVKNHSQATKPAMQSINTLGPAARMC